MTVKRTSLEAESIRSLATLSVSSLFLSLNFLSLSLCLFRRLSGWLLLASPSVLLSSGSRLSANCPSSISQHRRSHPLVVVVVSSSFRLAFVPILKNADLSTDNRRIRAQVRLSSGNRVK